MTGVRVHGIRLLDAIMNVRNCYARGIANRFSGHGEQWNDDKLHVLDNKIYAEESETAEPYPYGFVPTLRRYSLNKYEKKKGRTIFVCSMADLFGSWVPDSWIEEVFAACDKAPQHNYIFLTKTRQGTQIYLGRVF